MQTQEQEQEEQRFFLQPAVLERVSEDEITQKYNRRGSSSCQKILSSV